KGKSAKKKSNVVWVAVESVGFWDSDDRIPPQTFATAVRLRAGLCLMESPGKWVRTDTAELETSAPIPRPDFNKGPVDLNTAGRVYIEKSTDVKQWFAEEMVEVRRQLGPFADFGAFDAAMTASRKGALSEESKREIKKVEKAVGGPEPRARFLTG